jgi:nitrogen fixation/metabolism regulation signal transduction histidine kinase
MDESTLVIVAFIKDLMIIVSLGILIVLLVALAIAAFNLIGPVKSLKKTAKNLEEASELALNTTKDVSRTFSFFGSLNNVLDRVRERLRRHQEE